MIADLTIAIEIEDGEHLFQVDRSAKHRFELIDEPAFLKLTQLLHRQFSIFVKVQSLKAAAQIPLLVFILLEAYKERDDHALKL